VNDNVESNAAASDAPDHGLWALSEPLLDPLFWQAERVGTPSAWWAHVPFAHWVVAACRPDVLVELGTHTGVSYTAFCHAVQRAGLPTRCHAVDTWLGDSHAGLYDEAVFQEFRQFHDERFGAFSTLLRCTFDHALDCVEDGSVDLLHIDGLHTFEAVQHDYESWLPKLSRRAVVLFHDINERSGDFGAWRLWQALRGQHPSFTFLHGHGLGVLAAGEQAPEAIRALCAHGSAGQAAAIRSRFSRIGERWLAETRERMVGQRLGELSAAGEAREALLTDMSKAREAAGEALADVDRRTKEAETAVAQALADAAQARLDANRQILVEQARVNETRREAAQMRADMTRLVETTQARLDEARREAKQARADAARLVETARAQVDETRREAEQAQVDTARLVEAAQARAEVVRRMEAEQARVEMARLVEAAEARAEMARLAEDKAEQAHRDAVSLAEAEAERARVEAARLAEAGAERWRADTARLVRAEQASAALTLHAARTELSRLQDHAAALTRDLAMIQASTAWRMTWLLRRAGKKVPRWVRRGFRGGAKLVWWTTTLKLHTKLAERRHAPAQHADVPVAAPVFLVPPPPVEALPAAEPAPVLQAVKPVTGGKTRLIYISGERDTPGHTYRVERFVATALELGHEAGAMTAHEIPARRGEIERATVLVLWRTPWSATLGDAVTTAWHAGARIVFDVDDLMIDPGFARIDIIDGIRSNSLTEEQVSGHYATIRESMLKSDVCFTTTEELAIHMRGSGKRTHVLPNGFDQALHATARRARRNWLRTKADSLIRIGYAGGSRTHQRDFGCAVEAIARLLHENADCRLVLFQTPDGQTPLVDVEEYPALAGLADRIEWRSLQPMADLPNELARFDINIAPLEFNNPFCEAKSELKFWEAALVEVPTVASPTGPYRRAIVHNKTGFLAASADDWYVQLKRLASDAGLRQAIARQAYHSALANFGPIQRALSFGRVIEQLQGGTTGANAFALDAQMAARPWQAPKVFPSDIVFEHRKDRDAEVTVIVPLYNYEHHVVEALDSVLAQTLDVLDLVIVDGYSTDDSLGVAKAWCERNAPRFNRLVLLKNRANYGLGFCRNSGFDAADTPYVLPLDADNKLLPACCETLLHAIRKSRTAYVYPSIQQFGDSSAIISNLPYDPKGFIAGNYIDAMAMIDKEAWALVGGYDHVRHGWEDYDLWCRFAELGLRGTWHPEVLAQYRVHQSSIIRTLVNENYRRLFEDFSARHPWTVLGEQHGSRRPPQPQPHMTAIGLQSRLDMILPILRCPETGEKLAFNASRDALVSLGGLRSWPIVQECPVLLPGRLTPEIVPPDDFSGELPERALDLIRSTEGLVLNLGGGSSSSRFENVVELDSAIFRHTDIVADAHDLPFDDESFDSVIVMNGLHRYGDPRRVAAELHRLLKPTGRILVQTAFLQPSPSEPWHFFHCTRHGLAEWFKEFETDLLHVPDGFAPNCSLASLASESEAASRSDVSDSAADAFAAAQVGDLVKLWRDPSKRGVPLWTNFSELEQSTQDRSAAGFEFLGRKPPNLPNLQATRR
jgi:glycosyltransferase involved in cell wall biosynthesis/SAM-dependent methyltransferase